MNWIDCEVCLFSEQCDGPDYAPLCMDFDDDYDFDGYCDDSNPSQGVVGDRAPVIPEVTADTPSYLYEFIFEACLSSRIWCTRLSPAVQIRQAGLCHTVSFLGFKAGILGYSISEMKAHKK